MSWQGVQKRGICYCSCDIFPDMRPEEFILEHYTRRLEIALKWLVVVVGVKVRTLKAHSSFSSGDPELVMSVAIMNSLKSMVPLLSLSNMRNIWSTKVELSPPGRIWLHISTITFLVSCPSGQSCRNPRYHSLLARIFFMYYKEITHPIKDIVTIAILFLVKDTLACSTLTFPALERLSDTFQAEIAQLGALLLRLSSVSKCYCRIKSLSNMRGFIIIASRL